MAVLDRIDDESGSDWDEHRDEDPVLARCLREHHRDVSASEESKVSYEEREWVDVQSPETGRWKQGQIALVEGDRVHVRLPRPGHDQYVVIRKGSSSLVALHSFIRDYHQVRLSDLRTGILLDVYDGFGRWCVGRVLELDPSRNQVHVSCARGTMAVASTEWIDCTSYRLAPFGRFSGSSILETFPSKYAPISAEERTIESKEHYHASSVNETKFAELIFSKLGCTIVPMAGDGNCLFRSVSHQVYGDPELYHVVRAKCVDYIEVEREFFSKFVVRGDADFNSYLRNMRKDGEWGDHVEIQAISELYNRPVEVYAYNAEPIHVYSRRDSEASDFRIPIRLSYHFRSHYNSVVDLDRYRSTLLSEAPGTFEDNVIQSIRLDRSRSPDSPPPSPDASIEEIRKVLEESRKVFFQRDSKEYENIVNISLKEFESSISEKEKRDVAAAVDQSLAQEAETEMKRAIAESVSDFGGQEHDLLEKAITESLNSSVPQPVQMLVAAGYPLNRCSEAYMMVTSMVGTEIDDDAMVQYMTNYLLEGDVFGYQ